MEAPRTQLLSPKELGQRYIASVTNWSFSKAYLLFFKQTEGGVCAKVILYPCRIVLSTNLEAPMSSQNEVTP